MNENENHEPLDMDAIQETFDKLKKARQKELDKLTLQIGAASVAIGFLGTLLVPIYKAIYRELEPF